MFKYIKLVLQMVFKPYSLGDAESCKKFVCNVIALLKPMAAANKFELDDKIIEQLEYIVLNEELFKYFYSLVSKHLQADGLVFESASEDELQRICSNSKTKSYEAVTPFTLLVLATRIIGLINSLKKLQAK